MFSNTCRLCLADNPDYEIYENRLPQKIMTLLSVEIEEDDNMPKKICTECRMKVETLYIFKAKTLESDAALRKLLQTTGKGTDKRLSDAQHFVNQYNETCKEPIDAMKVSTSSAVLNEPERKPCHVKPPIIQKHSDTEYEEDYNIQVEVPEDNNSMVEEHVEWEFTERYDPDTMSSNDDSNLLTADPFEPPTKRVRHERNTPSIDPLIQLPVSIKNFIPDSDVVDTNPPHKFPLRTAKQVHETEAWLTQSRKHQNKIVQIVQRRLSNTPLHQALKKCFDYEVVDHFWHPKGQRRAGGTSITDLKLFNEVFEKALEGVDMDIDLDSVFRMFFKNARNCLRARRSRERQSLRIQNELGQGQGQNQTIRKPAFTPAPVIKRSPGLTRSLQTFSYS